MNNKVQQSKGFTLIEVMIAMVILLISLASLLGMFSAAVGYNANQGDSATRVIEYAQDKMEQLLALNFTDATTNTRVYPPFGLGGTGLGGNMAANTTVGGVTPGSPVTGYVDYLTATGTLQTTATNAFYVRQWSISTGATTNLKTITVMVQALKSLGIGGAPSTVLVCYKSKTT